MKQSHLFSSHRSGFTLVELLVVIGIIAILASVVLAGSSQAINAAKRARALATANQIVTAVQNYYTEYSIYPIDPNKGSVDTLYNTGPKWEPMMVALSGGVDPGNPTQGQVAGNAIPNNRQISYLSMNRSDLDTTLKPAVPKTPFKDPKTGVAEYYFLAIDSNYDNVLGDKDEPAGQMPDFSTSTTTKLNMSTGVTTGVAVWSNCDQPVAAPTVPNFWIHTY